MQFPKQVKIIAGQKKIKNNLFKCFDKQVIMFLSELSKEILKNPLSKNYSDLITLAFWIRNKNILKFKSYYTDKEIRYGRGLAFHITPSNIALNFVYSFVLSLLAGNSNIVRVPRKKFDQNNIFFSILKRQLEKKKFISIKNNNLFINYEPDESINNFFSKDADTRIIWGSDKTIQMFKKFETKPSCKDVVFPDRYSVSILNLKKIKRLNHKNLLNLTKKFYLDALVYDQNACTSPHLIIWVGKKNKIFPKLFWKYLNNQIKVQNLFDANEKKMFDKYNSLCELSAFRKEIKKIDTIDYINISDLKYIPEDIDKFRVGNGCFFEIYSNEIKNNKLKNNKKIQTITYYGFTKLQMQKLINFSNLINADRIVPVGRAIEFDRIWDGYDLIRELSKITVVN